MKILITGDSHTGALQRAKQLLLDKGKLDPDLDLTIRPMGGGHILPSAFYEDKGEYALITDDNYKRQFTRLPLEKFSNKEIIYGFSSPLHTTRLWRQHDWVNFVPLSLARNEAVISNNLLNRLIHDDCKNIIGMIDVMLRTQQRIFVIEAPKPFRRQAARLKTRPEVILFLDKYYRDYMRREFAKRAISVVSLGSECFDEEGFMLERYQSDNPKDLHHGNAEFGILMMKKVLELLKNEFPILGSS